MMEDDSLSEKIEMLELRLAIVLLIEEIALDWFKGEIWREIVAFLKLKRGASHDGGTVKGNEEMVNIFEYVWGVLINVFEKLMDEGIMEWFWK